MFGRGFSGHWNAIERERRVDWLVIFGGKDDFDCLLCYMGVEHHFPLVGPLGDFVQVFREEAMGGVDVGNTNEERGVISEEFDVGRDIIGEVIYINKEEKRAKHRALGYP